MTQPDFFGPTVHKRPLNIYDSFSPYIGYPSLQVAGQFSFEDCAIITGWYARTNVSSLAPVASRVWEAWTHSCTVTLIVGTRPVYQQPLSGLLSPIRPRSDPRASRHQMPVSAAAPDRSGTCEPAVLDVAMNMAYRHSGPLFDNAYEFWQTLDTAGCDHWVAMASVAMSVLQQPVLTVIPERQYFGVRIDQAALPGEDSQEHFATLVWVHLEGIVHRCSV